VEKKKNLREKKQPDIRRAQNIIRNRKIWVAKFTKVPRQRKEIEDNGRLLIETGPLRRWNDEMTIGNNEGKSPS